MFRANPWFSLVLTAAVAGAPLLPAQSAHAISRVSVAADETEAGKQAEYTITFTLEEDFSAGDTIYLDFDSEFELDRHISPRDIRVEGKEPEEVSVSGKSLEIVVDERLRKGDAIKVEIRDGITNPDEAGSYEISVETSEDDEADTGSIRISKRATGEADAFSVEIADPTEGARTSYLLEEFDLKSGSEELAEGEEIVVVFPKTDMLADVDDVDPDDVKVNGVAAKDVEIDRDEVTLVIPRGADGDDSLEIEFQNSFGLTNPDADDDYTITVKYDGYSYQSEPFEIEKAAASHDSFSVSLSDSAAGARSSYTFSAKLGNRQLSPGGDVLVQFPAAEMLPGILTPSAISVNGKPVRSAFAAGRTVTLKTSESITASSEVRVSFEYTAWITNPKTPGSYTISVTAAGTTLTSRPFSISGSATPPISSPPAAANNSTATIALTHAALNTAAGIQIGIKGLGMPLAKTKDFIEVVMPAGFRVPVYIAPQHVTVNGTAANYVSVRGQNILVYPAQDLPAHTPVTIIINQAANIVTPAVKNTYTISIYTSEEKGLLFARPVAIGGAVASVPPGTPATPASPAVPANAPRLKINVANFTKGGKTYPMLAAPYLANNSTTMVPAQFFKDGLALSTQWSKSSVVIVSGNKTLRFTVGSNKAQVGNASVTIPAAVSLKNNMPMVPVKFIADQLGYKVVWEAATSSIVIYK